MTSFLRELRLLKHPASETSQISEGKEVKQGTGGSQRLTAPTKR